jgi:hypothetical protein
MIKFKKNGRPNKIEKGLVKNINNLLSSLDEEQLSKYDFSNEEVKESSRLNYIWDMLNSDFSESKETENVDKETGEILEGKTIENNEAAKNDDSQTNTKEQHSESVQNVEDNQEVQEDGLRDSVRKTDNEGLNEDSRFSDIPEKTERVAKSINENVSDNQNNQKMSGQNLEVNESVGSDNDIPDFFSPIAAPVKERSYNKNEGGFSGEIEEPDYDGSSTSPIEEENVYDEQPSVTTSSRSEEYYEEEESSSTGFDNVRNEAMEEMDTKDKKVAVKNLADAIFSGLEMLHTLGQNFVKMPEDKIQEKILSGEIDPSMQIPIDEQGTTVSPAGFFEGYNEQVEEALAYEPEFEQKIRPALEREMMKRDMGMTDGQYIVAESLKYFGLKGVQAFQLKKQANQIMETFVTMTRETNAAKVKAAKEQRRQAVSPDAITTPPKPAANPISQQPHDEPDVVETVVAEETVD